MKKYGDYEQTQAATMGENEKLPVGGHICKILKVTVEDKHYGQLLRIGFDISEGESSGFYDRQYKRKKEFNADAKWPGMYYQTVREEDLRFFKGFMQAIEKSNPNFTWDWDEKKLAGKLFGGVFGEEEYEGMDGQVRASVKCRYVTTVEKIREGVNAPEIKRLQGKSDSFGSYSSYGQEVDNTDDLPF